jgi:hypothetical protein
MAVTRDILFNINDAAKNAGKASIPTSAAWDAGVVFNRTNGIPIDKWSIFKTYEDAQTYASSNPVAYPGQIVAVVSDDGQSDAYIIMGDGSLKAVGSDVGTQSEMTGATSDQDGSGGAVPAPKATEEGHFLRGDGTWDKLDPKDVWVNDNETLLNFIPIILTRDDYNKLARGETITLNGQPISYEPDRIYMIIKSTVNEEG